MSFPSKMLFAKVRLLSLPGDDDAWPQRKRHAKVRIWYLVSTAPQSLLSFLRVVALPSTPNRASRSINNDTGSKPQPWRACQASAAAKHTSTAAALRAP